MFIFFKRIAYFMLFLIGAISIANIFMPEPQLGGNNENSGYSCKITKKDSVISDTNGVIIFSQNRENVNVKININAEKAVLTEDGGTVYYGFYNKVGRDYTFSGKVKNNYSRIITSFEDVVDNGTFYVITSIKDIGSISVRYSGVCYKN